MVQTPPYLPPFSFGWSSPSLAGAPSVQAAALCTARCPYLHRTTGDTERKYHLRYYKTGTCIHETDARGHCVKNGLHCAFAHGPLDLRPPVCDVRELQAQEALQNGQLGSGEGVPDLQPGVLASQAMIEKILSEDPRWQDANFVLGSYKTEQCPKPPRLCRQGYACPHYHNSRDRRRNPRRFQYRSTPCPSVKHGDEWGEPSRCDGGDACQYCHSRTEQQFHPEVRPSDPPGAGIAGRPRRSRGFRSAAHHIERTVINLGRRLARGGKPGGPEGCTCSLSCLLAFRLRSAESLGMVNDWGCRDLHLTSPASTGSGQPGNAKRRDSPAEGGPKGNEQDSKQVQAPRLPAALVPAGVTLR
ncbi:PREDICTED: putative E3 ubiquitin-protein ligase UNKL [Colobus angolensis palliatus]|uniref:putative E3 ubiquitin-protein ligase UNKL n=1 Tax=Colobus angolensis palliatus TaxID=336983 RepID=UPI0005F3D0F3|nr:PREDICTED: putative E3 ubiquitin-protein ligase UNKL [Colobus angolensis palliatus]